MKAKKALLLAFAASVALVGAADEIDVAKQALRDGLWEVARSHAVRLEGDEAKFVILESFAREKKWTQVLGALSSWEGCDGEGFRYYRALALVETGRLDEASAELAAGFRGETYAPLADALSSRLALLAGDGKKVLDILAGSGFAPAGVEVKMSAAAVLESNGDRAGAERLWREVAADTNADERVAAVAAVNLGDAAALRRLADGASYADVRRAAGLRLGRLQIGDDGTFDEGARRIRSLVKDSPDAEGASEAFFALADSYLSRTNYVAAADAFRDAFETWPSAAKIFRLQEGRAWALRKLGKTDEALESFARAEEVATNDVERAKAILEQGDVLSDAGRGTEAMAKYRKVLESYPKTPAAERLKVVVQLRELEAKGRELYRDYRFEEARKTFAELAAADPARKPRAEYLDVLCLYGLGRDQDAYAKAKSLAETSPDAAIRSAATLWLAKFEYNRRRWGESHRLFTAFAEAAKDSPEAPAALTWAARAAYADNDFKLAIQSATRLAERYPDSPEKARAYLIQGESLVELSRFDEAVLVLERTLLTEGTPPEERLRAQVLKADALFAMGADNPVRYREALSAYRAVRLGESLSPSMKIVVADKFARTLEKLRRMKEAVDQSYTEVVLAYREGRQSGVRYDDEANAAFARAAFRLADEFESRGMEFQALHVLKLVAESDVPASAEAEKRIGRIQMKGTFL